MAQAKTGSDNGKSSVSKVSGEILFVALSDIFVDYDWNVRSKAEVLSETSDGVQDTTVRGEHHGEGSGIKGLVASIFNGGQDTAVIVRKVERGLSIGGKKTDRPFELICGFRRETAFEALQGKDFAETAAKEKRLSVVPGVPDGHIKAEVRELTNAEARILNGRENTDRKNLTTQDMCRYVVKLQAEDKLTQTQIAQALNIDQSYVSRLAKIATLPKPVLQHWAGLEKLPGLPDAITKRLTSREMSDMAKDLEGKTPGEVVERYIALLNPPQPIDGGGGDTSTDRPLKRIVELGTLLGALVRAGVMASDSLQWARVIGPKSEGFLVDTGKCDGATRQRYWDAMEDAYSKALAPPKAAPKTQAEKDAVAAS